MQRKIREDIVWGEKDEEFGSSLRELPVLIMVGVTGVGKTTLSNLLREERDFYLLPGRRELTTKVIIPTMQHRESGEDKTPNRVERFNYTRRYRKVHPGGMGYLLSELKIRARAEEMLLFDGLRGQKETEFAVKNLSQALFVVLTAPDSIRVKRLLNREDDFDSWGVEESKLEEEELDMIFSPTEKEQLREEIEAGEINPTDLKEKVEIILKEQENYKPQETKKNLLNLAPQRTIHLDSKRLTPQEMLTQVLEFIT